MKNLFILDYELVSPDKVKELRTCGSFLLRVLGIQEKDCAEKGDNTSRRVLIEELASPDNKLFYRVSSVSHFPAIDNALHEIPLTQAYDPSVIYDESGSSSGVGF